MRFLLSYFLTIILSTSLIADIIHVPSDYGTIQEGINASVDDDVVLIADGVYVGLGNKNLNCLGKRITIQSENGAEYCIIDCENNGRGFIFQNGETGVVDGLTICNGFISYLGGGGIYCEFSNPTIRNCVFQRNIVIGTLTGGGGIYNHYSSPVIEDCVFVGNSDGEGTIYGGGGIYNLDGEPVITNCVFEGNEVELRGGGIFNLYSRATVVNCVFKNNASLFGFGGGVANWESDATIINCLFVGNSAWGNGGGVLNYLSATVITNCTFNDNTANSGEGIYNWNRDNSGVRITNCIIWDEMINIEGMPSIVNYSNIQGGWTGIENIDANPLWVDYRLLPSSPCIDAGDNELITTLVDLDGNARLMDDKGMPDLGRGLPPIVDMGACEFQGQTHYGDVDSDDKVGLSDLATLLAHYGESDTVYSEGDLDRDGDVDLSDLTVLLSLYSG